MLPPQKDDRDFYLSWDFPSFALCPVTKELFRVKSTFRRCELIAECWPMQEQQGRSARAAEGQQQVDSSNWQQLFGWKRMKREKCLKLPPKLSANLDRAQVNLLPVAGSGCSVKGWEGVSVFCAERADTPQQKGWNPASLCFLLCGTLFSKAPHTCSSVRGFKNASRSLKFLVFHSLPYLTSGKRPSAAGGQKLQNSLIRSTCNYVNPVIRCEGGKRGKI